MMTNLFSIFDPSNKLWSLGWISLVMFILMMPPSSWIISNNMSNMFNLVTNLLMKEFNSILSSKKKPMMVMLISIFMFILYSNLMGLMPYIFNTTSHMMINLSMALPIWVAINLFGWSKNNKLMFAHLVPQSTPNVLMMFMVLIESISNLIRPMTLAIRLMANMIAGHLLMSLMGSQLSMSSYSTMAPMMSTQIMLSILELAVSVIQSYVFTILLTLYINEIPEE